MLVSNIKRKRRSEMIRANESARGQPGADTAEHYETDYTPAIREPVKTERKAEAKWRRTLREILARSDSTDSSRWLHRFLAERTCRDHTLPSTVSELQSLKGIQFERKEIVVPGFAGEPARVMGYRVAPESLARARDLLGLTAAITGPRSGDNPEDVGGHRRAIDSAAAGRAEAVAGT